MEFWDIYDENKELTGRTMKRNDWNMVPGDFHLTVLGVIQRTDGKYLITKRKMDKEWAPGWWEIPGGGVRAGESSLNAVCREIKEETGIDVAGIAPEKTYTYKRVNPEEKNNYFVDVYKFVKDFDEADVTAQEEETSGFKIASLEEIEKYAGEGIFLHYESIKNIFSM
ncbi:MAG: NUDIX hydrolase [Lachnospiraceae bacterium]|nr:NUDIX hydrolase [Lachnospiraceae bacterium]